MICLYGVVTEGEALSHLFHSLRMWVKDVEPYYLGLEGLEYIRFG